MDRDKLTTLVSPGKIRAFLGTLCRENGNSIIETALILPVVFLMTFGFIEYSLIIFGMGNANFASRAAVRYATLHSSTTYSPTTQTALNNIVGSYIFSFPANNYTVSSAYYNSNNIGNGVCITLNITYHFSVLAYSYSGISYSSTGCGVVQQ